MDLDEVLAYHKKVKNIQGKRWNKLTALRLFKKRNTRCYFWECACACGKKRMIAVSHVLKQKTCGCERVSGITKHGLSKSPIYITWHQMIARCTNPNHPQWEDYGARGITVCPEWRSDFKNFYDDMMPAWRTGLTLDRTQNNLGYSKANCRWATNIVQANNRRSNRSITIDGVTKNIGQWATENKISATCLSQRIKRGWEIKRALREPTDKSVQPVNEEGLL